MEKAAHWGSIFCHESKHSFVVYWLCQMRVGGVRPGGGGTGYLYHEHGCSSILHQSTRTIAHKCRRFDLGMVGVIQSVCRFRISEFFVMHTYSNDPSNDQRCFETTNEHLDTTIECKNQLSHKVNQTFLFAKQTWESSSTS